MWTCGTALLNQVNSLAVYTWWYRPTVKFYHNWWL